MDLQRSSDRRKNMHRFAVVGMAALAWNLSASPACAATPANEDAAEGTSGKHEAIVVTHRNILTVADAKQETEAGSRSTLTSPQLAKLAGLDGAVSGALRLVPGVHFGGGDGSGITEGTFSIRGFSPDQIGFARDGVPLNDPMFLTPHVDFMGDPDNYESFTVLYGSSSATVPSFTTSGGSVEIRTRAPEKQAGLVIKQGFGSYDLFRTYVRADMGEHKGWSAWVSGSNTMGSLWTQGGGELWSRRFEGNLQYEWGAGNRINFIASDFKMHTNSYFHPTLSQYGTEPYDQGYSQAIYPTVGNGTNGQSDILVASGNSAALQRADFAIQTYALNGLFQLSPSLTLHVDPYYVRVNHGTASVAATSLPESLVGRDLNGDGDLKDIRPVALSVYPVQHRLGGTVRADWNITASNHLELGTWIDHVNGRFAMIAQTIGQDGAPVSKSGEGQILDGNGNPLNFTDQHNLISTQKAWLQDSWDFLPGWNLVAGLAWQHSRLRGSNGAGLFTGAEYSRTANYSRFLPNASLTLQASKSNQFYYNLNSNMRIPAVASLYQGTNSFEKQKQETTLNQEVGWRYSSPAVLVSAALFLDQFHNRQVSYQVVSGVTSYFNAGDVTTRGVEASVNGKLPYNFTYNLSWTHVAAKQKSDYTTGGLVADTAGKQIYNTPKDLISWGIGYDDSHLYGNILGRYTSGYFGDLENYEKIPPYTIFDLAIGYRIDRLANFLHKIVVSVNVNNLFDNKTLSNVYGGSVSANPSSPFYAAPTYNRGQPRAVLANLTFEL